MKIREMLSSQVAAISGWLGLLVMLLIFFLFTLRSKEFSFGVVAQSTLVDLSEERLAEFQVVFQGEEMQWVEAITVRFENSGDIPIEVRDFDGPMFVRLAKGSRILSASVAERSPKTLGPIFSIKEGNQLSIEPLLLNRGDSFSISVVIDGDPGVPELTARIADVPRVTRIEPPKQPTQTPGFMLGFGIVGFVAYMYLAGMFPIPPFRRGMRGPRVVPWIDGFLLTLVSGFTSATLLSGGFTAFDVGLPIMAAAIVSSIVVGVPVLRIARWRTRGLLNSPTKKQEATP